MTFPFQFGWQQILLLLVAIIGVALLISAVTGLMHTVKELEEFEDEEGRTFRRWRRRRRFRWRRGTSGIILALLAISLLWLTGAVQTYLGLTSNILVARISATSFTNEPHKMNVQLTLIDSNGHEGQPQNYLVNGDEWMLQGDILKFPDWMNILGFHSGFKLTRLEGRYDDSNLERTAPRSVYDLNGGDDNFFTTAQNQAWTNPFVQAAYGSSTFLKADGRTYDIYASQDAITARPEK
ncbi:MAG TPA: hypothetical protein VKX46_20625 [Ktedonobacteraceae bacterium]|nr:hypothetical protein [Ktedonobacteraceae bacterium]